MTLVYTAPFFLAFSGGNLDNPEAAAAEGQEGCGAAFGFVDEDARLEIRNHATPRLILRIAVLQDCMTTDLRGSALVRKIMFGRGVALRARLPPDVLRPGPSPRDADPHE